MVTVVPAVRDVYSSSHKSDTKCSVLRKRIFEFVFVSKYSCFPLSFSHQYYLSLRNFISEGKLDLSSLQIKTIARLCALIAHIECGDFSQERVPKYSSYIPMSVHNVYAKSSDLQKDAAIEHAKLLNSPVSESKIEFLHIACCIQGYGIEVFHGRLSNDKMVKKVDIYVGSDGIRIFSLNREFDEKQGKDVARRILEKR